MLLIQVESRSTYSKLIPRLNTQISIVSFAFCVALKRKWSQKIVSFNTPGKNTAEEQKENELLEERQLRSLEIEKIKIKRFVNISDQQK